MGRHAYYETVYGILIDDDLEELIQEYYGKDFNLDEDNMYYETEYDKACDLAKEEFGINLFSMAENSPWGYLGVELKSDQWFEFPKQMTYKQLQNRIREATEDEANDFKKRLYYFKAVMNIPKDDKTLDDKCGYYKYWLYQ